jgi:hypothetical protein
VLLYCRWAKSAIESYVKQIDSLGDGGHAGPNDYVNNKLKQKLSKHVLDDYTKVSSRIMRLSFLIANKRHDNLKFVKKNCQTFLIRVLLLLKLTIDLIFDNQSIDFCFLSTDSV